MILELERGRKFSGEQKTNIFALEAALLEQMFV